MSNLAATAMPSISKVASVTANTEIERKVSHGTLALPAPKSLSRALHGAINGQNAPDGHCVAPSSIGSTPSTAPGSPRM